MGVVSRWNFDEPSGTTALDAVDGNDGTLAEFEKLMLEGGAQPVEGNVIEEVTAEDPTPLERPVGEDLPIIDGALVPQESEAESVDENEEEAERRISSEMASDNFISGDALSSADHVTGTQRGSEHNITGTSYYKADPEGDEKMDVMERIKKINNSFSVRIPQRESQERAGTDAVNAPTAESLITGTFSAGEGKITGNQEFRFNPRPKVETIADKSRVTGEGRVEGKTITGSAWISKDNVTGTEGHIAAERNPSQRKGDSHAWAGARKFKDKGGTRPEPTHHVTGMVGWSPKASVPITVSGGGQG